ncbi:MAG: GNAT family N-acetyltransferase [Verrucomicrobiota bacterium]
MIVVSSFDRSFDRGNFSCGNDELDKYLQRQLSQDAKRNLAAGFILHDKGKPEVLGYYTLSAFSVDLLDIPEAPRKKLPRYPQVPVTLLGRLAISSGHQGRGLGELLLVDALKRAWQNRNLIGSWAVIVDAIDDSAAQFYQAYGFELVTRDNSRLFLTMSKIGKLV